MDRATLLARIRECFASNSYVFTWHAIEKGEERGILIEEVEEAVLAEDAEIIEDYPEDSRGPSCLILGWTARRRPLHVQVSYPPEVRVITVYEPELERWIGYRVRR
ncbi:MAG TPA: DUF4258 domain-containing protein [Candidatus Krumholzibacteria bacterium]